MATTTVDGSDSGPVPQVNGSTLGNALASLLGSGDILPGDQPSYQTCKAIYLFHPLGAKIVEKPVKLAMSQKRKITVQEGPEDLLVEEFNKTWSKLDIDKYVFSTRVQSKIYGITSCAIMIDGITPEQPLEWAKIKGPQSLSFNVYDPLNTAGSLVTDQNPLSMKFQHVGEIRVNGATFHRSRAVTIMNEFPVYINYESAAFGFTGRSCYQRSLYPLKSYVQTMVTNDMVSLKAGVIVATIKQASAWITQTIRDFFARKRAVVQQAVTGNVISVGDGEKIESIDLKNLGEPYEKVRTFIIQDIASGTPMPAKMLTEESFAEGFGEGTEDAKEQARFIDGEREQMQPLYDFFDPIVMHLAWTRDFFDRIQQEYPEEYGGLTYEAAFYSWKQSFHAEWPSLLKEPDSEAIRVEDVKFKAMIALYEVYRTDLPPRQKAEMMQWIADSFNELKLLFGSPLILDYNEVEDYLEDNLDAQRSMQENQQDEVVGASRPFAREDSDARVRHAFDRYQTALEGLTPEKGRKLKALTDRLHSLKEAA